jgi:UPF0271 protein
LDLNTDLGESFGTWTKGADAAMFPLVTSASVACGMHAGDPVTMLDTCRAAYELDVNVGAHIGYPDLAGFGLRSLDMTFDDLFGAVLYQLGALDGVAHAVGASVDYVKLHGALYDRTVHDAEQACWKSPRKPGTPFSPRPSRTAPTSQTALSCRARRMGP